MHTDFYESKLKRKKVQFLIEEIPTIEHIKKSCFSIFKDRFCPICNIEKEEFNHVWTCNQRSEDNFILIQQIKQILIDSINDHIENQALYVEDIDLPDLPYIWDNSIREDFFTSIDIIKGIIPLSLCKFINGKLKNYKKTKEILYNFRKISFNLIRDFWNERCSVYHEINIALGITKNVLKEQYGKEKCITTKKPPTDKKYNDTEGLVNYIRYGGKIIDYYNCCVP
ncbi:hypothetical protein GLOIN_2v1762156 [Rhizophagus irregularis DAOM 181602=DAOM 197198]|nr:hypothetical protein GLOIN_2v1762156 [Rhizophagus irregularis DAOM 181602=DAOM 197198]